MLSNFKWDWMKNQMKEIEECFRFFIHLKLKGAISPLLRWLNSNERNGVCVCVTFFLTDLLLLRFCVFFVSFITFFKASKANFLKLLKKSSQHDELEPNCLGMRLCLIMKAILFRNLNQRSLNFCTLIHYVVLHD